MRRRYDTQTFDGHMASERRNTWLLGLLGLGILAFLIFFYAKHIGGEVVPTVPTTGHADTPHAGTAKRAPRPTPAELAAPVAEAAAVLEPAAPAEPAAPSVAFVTIDLGKAGPLWVNDKLIGAKVKTHDAELLPGKHTLKTKLGKKHVFESLSLESGQRYRVHLDPKKKRLVAEAAK